VFKKLYAVRAYRREKQLGDISSKELQQILAAAQTTAAEAQEIFHLTAMANFAERYVIPPMMREQAIEATEDVNVHKGHTGFGFLRKPAREW
jgi:nitrate reductase beta subunit